MRIYCETCDDTFKCNYDGGSEDDGYAASYDCCPTCGYEPTNDQLVDAMHGDNEPNWDDGWDV